MSPRLLVDLARQPLWLVGICGDLSGFILQVVALKFGPLALVEPILVCDLIFASVIASYLRRQWDPVMLTGVVACAAGVAGFLVISRPTEGRSTVSLPDVLPLAVGLAAAMAGCLVLSRLNRQVRPLALALACGIAYGVAAFLVKLITSQFSGIPQMLAAWPIYAVAVIGPLGFLLNQNAFQQGTLIAPVLAVITAMDPLVSIGLAHLWLHESLTSSAAGAVAAGAALLLMVGGIVVLAHRTPVAAQPPAGQPAG